MARRTNKNSEAAHSLRVDDDARIARREQSIRDEARLIRDLELELARERFLRAQGWLRQNRSDIAQGEPVLAALISDDDSLSLPELEEYGANGNAVLIATEELSDVGELWWCDPEGRSALLQRFAFYTKAGCTSAAFSLQYAVEPRTADAS